MEAIKEISALDEWEKEWLALEEEISEFKQSKYADYIKKMNEFQAIQKAVNSAVSSHVNKVKAFKEKFADCSESASNNDDKKKVIELQDSLALTEAKLSEMDRCLPKKSGLFLRLCLGNINVSLFDNKLAYKNEYEKFKLKMTIISFIFSAMNLFFLHYRLADALFHGVLLWYYSTLTLQEHILKANGSRIKGWWVLHHYLSILLSGFLLIWPEGKIYQMFRTQFYYFSIYLALVQFFQYQYQSGILYRLRALGISGSMDTTLDGFHSWMWRGLGFIIPILLVGYLFQFYNAYTLFVLSVHPDCHEWQVCASGILFLLLSVGNTTTLMSLVRQKIAKTFTKRPKFPCE